MARRDIGELLLQAKMVTPEILQQARGIHEKSGGDLGNVLLDMGVDRPAVFKAKAHMAGVRFVDVSTFQIDPSAVNVVPAALANRHKIMPLAKKEDQLVVAMVDPTDIMATDDLKMATGNLKVTHVLGDPDAIEAAITRHYGSLANPTEVVPATTGNGNGGGGGGGSHASDLARALGELPANASLDADVKGDLTEEVQAPIIRIAHTVIQQAVAEGASDIHIEPSIRNTRIRYRIDGVLHEIMTLPKHIHPPLTSRFKIMSEMNIAERRVPQDGRIAINYQGKDYDLRVSCLPTMLGEKIVMRILDKSGVMLGLEKLGFFPDSMAQIQQVISQPNGLILTTGPTGAGKTTTLYSVLNRVNSVEKNIMTIEDPVEYQLPGISQVQVQRKAGLTFATALRSFMRQDPDIIMVGEIRDLETAEMAIQASLTGHLVLSTLHTNDAPSSVTRLVDMGVEPFLISATLVCAMAQRLSRRICDKCKEQYEVEASELRAFGFVAEDPTEKVPLWRGRGCENCRNTGYRGRLGIYEIMLCNEEVHEMIVRRAPVPEIRAAGKANGMKTLQDDGLRKILAGMTTAEEIRRVVFTAGH